MPDLKDPDLVFGAILDDESFIDINTLLSIISWFVIVNKLLKQNEKITI